MTEDSPKQTKRPRLPYIHTNADIDNMSHLSEEEKALAKKSLKKTTPTDTLFLMLNDPELQALFQVNERSIESLLAPDYQAQAYSPMTLFCLELARLTKCEFMLGNFALIAATSVKSQSDLRPALGAPLLAMLGCPDSDCWTDEQRLSLKFVRACHEHSMPEELFNEALETWGKKKTLRHIYFIGLVNTAYMITKACDMPWDINTVPEFYINFTPESLPFFYTLNEKALNGVMKVWDSTPDLPGL
ncbi:MAG: hypothetical protein KJP07_19080 [Desulfatitalea sp.]|nr:hypothetical protein [Desulfatitalea sp.]